MLCVRPQSSLIDLKEHASSLASSGLKKDSKLKSLEIAIEQKKEECSKLETQLQKVSLCKINHTEFALHFISLQSDLMKSLQSLVVSISISGNY